MRANPNWRIRRRYIFAAFALGFAMILSAVMAVWQDKLGAGDLVTGGVALITLILTSYIFGAAWEDKEKYSKQLNEENLDG
jgi:hypothetical protein